MGGLIDASRLNGSSGNLRGGASVKIIEPKQSARTSDIFRSFSLPLVMVTVFLQIQRSVKCVGKHAGEPEGSRVGWRPLARTVHRVVGCQQGK